MAVLCRTKKLHTRVKFLAWTAFASASSPAASDCSKTRNGGSRGRRARVKWIVNDQFEPAGPFPVRARPVTEAGPARDRLMAATPFQPNTGGPDDDQ